MMRRRVLLISYFFTPFQGVGSLRPSYWYEQIPLLSGGHISVDVVTATPQPIATPNIFVIKPMPIPSSDQGLGWICPLLFFLYKKKSCYDIFLFTGGPFLHFLLSLPLKIFGKKIILDYRDPFSNNPVFIESKMKKKFKSFLELVMNSSADLIVSVNNYCLDLIARLPSTRTVVIDNGFDERISPIRINLPDSIKIFLAGGFSYGRDVSPFFNSLSGFQGELKLYHAGSSSLGENSPHYEFMGYKSYSELLGLIMASDICILFTSGHPYESTTKIFDYIRFNKKVLIVSDNMGEGALKEITKTYPNVQWVLNNERDIRNGLMSFADQPVFENFNYEVHSRKVGAFKLIKEINQL